MTDEGDALRAHATAIKLLGPRDHSRRELFNKLATRGFEEVLVNTTLDALEARGYLDDARYACRLAEQRAEQGHGPASIRAKLHERGVDGSLISAALDSLECDWSEVACEALRRKFTQQQLADRDDRVRSKVARFLRSRGFSSSESLAGLRLACREDAFD